MARPKSEGVVVRRVDTNPTKPYGVFWRRDNPKTGERERASKFFTTEAEALACKADVDAALATLKPLPSLPSPVKPTTDGQLLAKSARKGALTFRQHADDVLAKIISRRKPSTAKSYADNLRLHVYPVIGDVRLTPSTFTADNVLSVVAAGVNRHQLRNGTPTARNGTPMSWGTQKAVIRIVSSILRWAVRFGHLYQNPCAGLIKELRDDSSIAFVDPEPNPLTKPQIDDFLDWVDAVHPSWFPYFQTLYKTGMRRGEAAELRWTDLDLDIAKPFAKLARNYSPAAARNSTTGRDGTTTLKNKKWRAVDVRGDSVDVLRRLRLTRKETAFKTGRPESPYVFLTDRGARVVSDCSTAERVFAAGMRAIGAANDDHTIHDLRDTFATVHLNDGTPVAWISRMLGHGDIATTLRRYAKWKPTDDLATDYAAALDSKPALPPKRKGGAR